MAGSLAGYLWSSVHQSIELEQVYKDYSYDEHKAAEGRYLFGLGCARCHVDRAGTLGPQELKTVPDWLGRVRVPNLSRDPLFGNSEWTDEDLWRVLAHDVGRQGMRIPATMPAFRQLDEDDIERLVAFLRLDAETARPVTVASIPSQYAAAGVLVSHFLKPRDVAVRVPSIRGQYLADVVMGCGECHSSQVSRMAGNLDYEGSGASWSGSRTWMVAPTLRGRASAVGHYDPEQLAVLLRRGQTADGHVVEMPLYPDVTTADVRAIWAYLDALAGPAAQRTAPPLALLRGRNTSSEQCRQCHNPVPALGTEEFVAAHGAQRTSGSYYSYRSPVLTGPSPR